MVRKAALTVLLSLLAGSSAAGQDWARKMFETTSHDFGSVARGAKAEFRFLLKNVYGEDIHIAHVRSTCGCTNPRIDKQLLQPGETSGIVAALNTQSFYGRKGATVTVTFDRPHYAEVQLQVRTYIRSDVVFHPGSVQLGHVDHQQGAGAQVTVDYAGRNDWTILKVDGSNPHLSVEFAEAERRAGRVKYTLDVHLHKDAPTGYVRDFLTLVTDDRQSARIPLLVEGRVTSAVTVSPPALFMGVVEPEQEVTKKLVVRGKKPFRIISIRCDDAHFKIGATIDDVARSVHLVPVTFVAGTESGKVMQTIRIETDLGVPEPEPAAYAVVQTQ